MPKTRREETYQQSKIFQKQSLYRIEKSAEVSMEADPGTFTADSLCRYMSLGVNRFSIGIQAFQQVHSTPPSELSIDVMSNGQF